MKPRPSKLDELIGYISPVRGLRRTRARFLQNQLSDLARSFEGASKGRRMDGWLTGGASANAESRGALGTLRNRARYLVANEGYAGSAVNAVVNNTVGAGIIPQSLYREDEKSSTALNDLWKRWADGTACDAAHQTNIYGLQALAMRTTVVSGECIVRRIYTGSREKGLAVPLRLQLLEPDYIDTEKNEELKSGGFIIQGIEYDSKGTRVAYWLFPHHPGEDSFLRARLDSKRVPADDISCPIRLDRPGQVRGIPWLAIAIVKLKELSEFSDATLVRQKIAACFTAFVHDSEQNQESSLLRKDQRVNALGDMLEPGLIEVLPPGRDVKFSNPPGATGFEEFSRPQLRNIAAGIGVTYEALTKDYSQVNFSSARMGAIEFRSTVDQWRYHMLIPNHCVTIYSWFLQAALISGKIRREPDLTTHTPPRREMIDPATEVAALISSVRGGLTSLSQAIRENGYDPDEVFQEIARDNTVIDQLKLILDSDARKVMKAGILQHNTGPGGTQAPGGPTKPKETSSEDEDG